MRAFVGILTVMVFWMASIQLIVVDEVDALYEWNGAAWAEKSVDPFRCTIEMGYWELLSVSVASALAFEFTGLLV